METVGLRAGPPRLPAVRPPPELLNELRELFDAAGVPQAQLSREEAQRIWDRFSEVDVLLREAALQYAPRFQGGESHYRFIDMPDSAVFDELIGN